ncbi:MAG: hypothetical protein ACSHX8_08490 [Opitutaceae bacterium]
MNLYHTTDANGITEINPCETRMSELIDELDDINPDEVDHPDVSLIHDTSGWMITLYPKGIVSLENFEDADEVPRHMKAINRKKALKLWMELAQGDIESVTSHPWTVHSS